MRAVEEDGRKRRRDYAGSIVTERGRERVGCAVQCRAEDSRSAHTSAVCSGYQWMDKLLDETLREASATVKSHIFKSTSTLNRARSQGFKWTIFRTFLLASTCLHAQTRGFERFDFSLGLTDE